MLMPSNGPMDYKITNEAEKYPYNIYKKGICGREKSDTPSPDQSRNFNKGDLYYVGIEYLMQTIIFSMNVLSWWIIE